MKTPLPFPACRVPCAHPSNAPGGLFGEYMKETKKKNGRTRLWVRLSDDELARLRALADAEGVTPGKMIGRLLERGDGGRAGGAGAAMQTLVALVRVPVRAAEGFRCAGGRLPWLCREWMGGGWEAEFDEAEAWGADVRARFGCAPEDREAFEGLAVGFVEPGSEAEKTIARLLEDRAEPDRERGAAVAAGLAEVAV